MESRTRLPSHVVFLGALLLSSTALGQADEEIILIFDDEESPPPEASSPAFTPSFLFRGTALSDQSLDLQFDGNEERIFRSTNRLSMDATMKLSNALHTRVSGRMTYWAWMKESGFDHAEFESELRDSYLHWTITDTWQSTLGLQTWSWGATELFPVYDVLNPRDLRTGASEGVETPKVPVFGLTIDNQWGQWIRSSLVWIPFFEADRQSVLATDYGVIGGPSTPSPLTSGFGTLLQDINPAAFHDVDQLLFELDRPDETLWNNSVGLRFDGAIGTVDWAVGTFYGWDTTPVLGSDPCLGTVGELLGGELAPSDLDFVALSSLLVEGAEPPEFPEGTCPPEALFGQFLDGSFSTSSLFQTRYERRWTTGLDLTIPFGDVLSRVEASWSPNRVFYTSNLQSIREPILAGTAGLEYVYDARFTGIIELNYSHILGLDSETELFGTAPRNLQGGILLSSRWLDYDALEFQLAGIYGITLEEWMLLPSVGYRFTDGFLGQLGVRIYQGEGTSAGSLFNTNDEVYVLIRWDF